MERGEVDAMCGLSLTSFYATGSDKTSEVVAYWYPDQGPGIGDAVDLFSRIENDRDRRAARLLIGSRAFNHSIILPAGTPEETVKAYRDAFAELASDPEFKEAMLERNADFQFRSGSEIEDMIRTQLDVDEAVVDHARKLIE